VRILLVTGVYPTPYRPTKGTFNATLIAGLRAAGDSVRVVAPVPWTDLLQTVRGAAPDAEARYPLWIYPPRLSHASHHRWMQLTGLPAIRRITEKWHPDIVLGYWTHPDGAVALRAARMLGVPGVLLVGGSDVQLLTAEPARRAIITETLRLADRILTVGVPLAKRVAALGISPDRIGSFQRGVDASRFFAAPPAEARARLGLPLGRHVIVWVGRMVPVKGLDVLFEALPRVRTSGEQPLMVLVGDGEERAKLAARAHEWPGDVRFVGTVPHEALPDWYRAADLIVLPSRSEGMPNVLLEALACGTPFVASDVGSISELLEPASRVVTPDDPGALAAALSESLQAPPMSRRASATLLDRTHAIAELRRSLQGVLDVAAAQGTGGAQ